jgi:hypothetical protein
MNYERVEMANGKSDGTEVPFRRRGRLSARRVWAIHRRADIVSLDCRPLRVGRAGRCSKTLSCGERGGRRLIVSGCAVFDPEVTAYDVRLPESRRYGEG